MNSKDEMPPSSGITSVANRRIQPSFNAPMQRCRQHAMEFIAEHLNVLFSQVDDTLFAGAEQAANNKVQTMFFDAMRDLRKLRPHIERSYQQYVIQHFTDFLSGKAKPANSDTSDETSLSLVEEAVYEEILQVTNMVSKVKARNARALFALEQRLALLNHGQKINEDSNPFGPYVLADSLRKALAPYTFNPRIKQILYMLFERNLMTHLDQLYEQLNQGLIEAGILPNLKFTARRASATPSAPPTQATQTTAAGQSPTPQNVGFDSQPLIQPGHTPSDLSAPPPQDPQQLLAGLAMLLNEHRQSAPQATLPGGARSITSFAPAGATSTYKAEELLDAINRLQHQSATTLSVRLHGPQQVDELKKNLQEQLEAVSQKPGQQRLSGQEADVIDLVGMLFDFILDDDNLPSSCKTALSHLHTPYLRIALQDRALFTLHHHPARRLLNSMAQAGVLYGTEGDERGLLAKIHWVVERVINSYNGDLALLESLLDEFNEFVSTLKHRVELRERRAVEAAKGRDKLLSARQQAAQVTLQLIAQQKLPKVIHNFLEHSWTDVLVFILLRHGTQSDEWKNACETAGQLAWSVTPLDAEGRMRLQHLRITLLEQLRQGIEMLGAYHEDGIRRLLQDIVACQHAIQAQQPTLAENIQATLLPSPLGAMLGEDAHLAQTNTQAASSKKNQKLIKELQQLEFGTWFEFGQGEHKQQLKLSWFSPTTANYMFVDHSGQRVAVRPISQLADEIEQGLARIINNERNAPLMDRAMGAIYRVLQRFTGRSH